MGGHFLLDKLLLSCYLTLRNSSLTKMQKWKQLKQKQEKELLVLAISS